MNLSYRSPKTDLRNSPIHGKGLFAQDAISQGEVVAVKGGYVLPSSTWLELERTLGPAEIQIGEDLYVAPISQGERDGSMLYINHSCDPNCAIQGQIVFVAMRDIEAGEELSHDWATTDDMDYVLDCNCGTSKCRGTVTGKDWMKKDLQRRYKGWFCWHVQRKIDAQ